MIRNTFIFLALIIFIQPATANTFVCTIPELELMVKEISSGQMDCPSLVPFGLDPHHLEVQPSVTKKINSARQIISIGIGLEDKWLSKLAQKQKVYELGPKLDPIRGEHHRGLDPHVLLSPLRVAKAYHELAILLKEQGCSSCIAKSEELALKLNSKIKNWTQQLSTLSSHSTASYHGSYNYFLNDMGLSNVVSFEGKNGVPTMKELTQKLKLLDDHKVKIILLEPFAPQSFQRKIKELRPSIKVITLPIGLKAKSSFIDLFSSYVDQLTKN